MFSIVEICVDYGGVYVYSSMILVMALYFASIVSF